MWTGEASVRYAQVVDRRQSFTHTHTLETTLDHDSVDSELINEVQYDSDVEEIFDAK